MKTYTPEELKAEVAKHEWWHRIDLGHGIVTPGLCEHGQTEQELTERWGLPERLDGKNVFDIGCWDGLFSAACLRRGAREVTGMDVVHQPTFNLVRDALGHHVPKMQQLTADAQHAWFSAIFDVVLCYGVIYHVERPLEVIRNAVRAAKELVIVETALAEQVATFCNEDAGLVHNPLWIQDRGHEGDASNIWYPTGAAVIDALKAFGCREAHLHHHLAGGGRATFIGTK